MVAQVGGQIRVHARGPHLLEEAVAGPAAHRDGTDRRGRVACDPQSRGSGGQPAGGLCGEFGQAQRVVERTDPAEAAAALGVGRVGHQRAGDPQAHRGGQRVGDAGVGAVGVGVRHVEADAGPDQVVDDLPFEAGAADRGDRGGAAQIQRVVGDQQAGAGRDRLVHDLLDGVDGEEDPADVRGGVAAHQAHGVPRLGQCRGPESVEGGGDVGEAGHI